jgi:two-component system, NarL family, response regulator NreC
MLDPSRAAAAAIPTGMPFADEPTIPPNGTGPDGPVAVQDAPPTIRALVVDDHEIVREALTVILEADRRIKVLGCASNGEDAILTLKRLTIDLVIMDLMLPVIDGIEATRRIMHLFPQTHIIVFSGCESAEQVCRALRAGARGYVLKAATRAELPNAIQAVIAGGRYVSSAITSLFSGGVLSTTIPENPLDTLSAREREVLRYIVAGSSSSAIGLSLSLSRKTVDTYRGRMMAKLQVSNRSALIRLAVKHTLPSL